MSPEPRDGYDLNEEPPDDVHDTASEWPKPNPEMFHGLAGEIVGAIDDHTEADRVGVLLSLLTMFGASVGAGPHAIADGVQHPARLFAALVGETSSGRKGTATARARQLMYYADSDFAATRILGGFGSGEVLVDHVADPDEDGKGGAADKRLLVLEPELARILKVANREGSTLSPIIREAWDGGRLAARSRQRTTVASGTHICCLAHVTKDELRRHLTDTEVANGFANRFLFSLVRRSKRLPEGGSLDDQVVAEYGRCLRDRLHAARKFGRLQRTDDARKLWAELYDAMADDEPGGLLGAVAARPEAQTLRLSVVYALLDGSNRIDVEHLEAAWAVWCYCRRSAEYLFADVQGDPIAERLLAAIRRAGDDGLDFTGQSEVFGRNVNAVRLRAARTSLEDSGLIVTEVDPTQTVGRPRMISRRVRVTTRKSTNQRISGFEPDLDSSTSFVSYDPNATAAEVTPILPRHQM